MKFWEKTLIRPNGSIMDAVQILDSTGAKICLVANDDRRLIGTVTDGDIRRGLLQKIPLESAVSEIMNSEPLVALPEKSRDEILEIMAASRVEQIPLVDADGLITGLHSLADPAGDQPMQDNWVVLMAGGLGQRLRPMTEKTPKPLLPIEGKPLLEIILERFLMQNFHRFYISVNYKSEQITEHFGDGSQWDAEIRYLHEEKPLGTAGGLGLIEETPTQPLIVMNGDLLTKVDFRQLLNFHHEQNAAGTLAVQPYEMRVPFGVVDIEGGQVRKIDEKPVSSFFVNAGIYIVEPDVLESVGENEYLDSPDLFTRLAAEGKGVGAYPLREYWLDIGRMDDFERANAEFRKEFP